MDTQKVGELLDDIMDTVGKADLYNIIDDNWHANLISSANEIQEILRKEDEDRKEFTPVIRMARTEIEMLGGNSDDIDYIAEKTQEALFELGYWDVVKTVIALEKL